MKIISKADIHRVEISSSFASHGRIDIGLGQSTSGELQDVALRTDRNQTPAHDQAQKVDEILGHLYADLPNVHRFATLSVMPDVAPPTPWIMAVSPQSAARAGALGLPLALSAFHRPDEAIASAKAYRTAFRPSERQGLPDQPQLFIAMRLSAATTLAEAEARAMPLRWAFDQRRRHKEMPRALPSIAEAIKRANGVWPAEKSTWPMYVITSLRHLKSRILSMAEAVGADEIMLQDALPDAMMRLEHYSAVVEALSRE